MLILASNSPRRKDILTELGVDFVAAPSNIDEIDDPNLSPAQNAEKLAREKAEAVAPNHPDTWVLGVDTLVVVNNQIIGKPKDAADAERILRSLSGGTHDVISGIALIKGDQKFVESETTHLRFAEISEEEIAEHIASDRWHDKSGAFTIQGRGSLFIEHIDGDFYNVVGFPIYRFGQMCKKAGLRL